MRRMGFEVTAIDASLENIGTASTHAAEQGLDIAYRGVGVPERRETADPVASRG